MQTMQTENVSKYLGTAQCINDPSRYHINICNAHLWDKGYQKGHLTVDVYKLYYEH